MGRLGKRLLQTLHELHALNEDSAEDKHKPVNELKATTKITIISTMLVIITNYPQQL